MEIEWCVQNASTGAQEALKRLQAVRPDVSVRKYACMEQCALCARRPFAVIGGSVVEAETPEGLADQLLAILDAQSSGRPCPRQAPH
ncbi:DUF1450 domain-containing protein [Alicyclobacillus vulcanalis]|uniref:Uncharacterized protein YuzB, UPF0349 family n=1 Tax=Alicyclobacillus vulcanalis TaxID=252246 RepID=A0A1N7P4U1_9BACL|nr:DUF1450 domain-containing protein [Alicyclobacillus vulcanalis]SIT05578.1 Uncharacterized protein YuzB, UPF0349 family [Alicyclobacillus vulcanalis]